MNEMRRNLSDIQLILDNVKEICEANCVQRCLLYGSYVRGDATKWSDIDLAVWGCDDSESFTDDIDNINTLLEIDVVFIDSNGTGISQDFLEEVEEYGIQVY